MQCPACAKEVTPDSFFCPWCSEFVPAPGRGKKAGIFARFMALLIDPLVAILLYGMGIALFGSLSSDAGVLAAIFLPLVYLGWFLTLLRKGLTPGKRLLNLQVVDHQTGAVPGFGKMFVREIPGRFLSGLVFSLGYFWALFDKNAQAWHDKLAGTVVIRPRAAALAPGAAKAALSR